MFHFTHIAISCDLVHDILEYVYHRTMVADQEITTLFGPQTQKVLVHICDDSYDILVQKYKLSNLQPVRKCVAPDCQQWLLGLDTDKQRCGRCTECCSCIVCAECGHHLLREQDLCLRCNLCCCECQVCINAGCTNLQWCEACQHCSEHCECYCCHNCGERGPDLSVCERGDCEDCCECDREDYPEIEPGSPWYARSPKMRQTFKSSRLVGVEWEYVSGNYQKLATWANQWRGGIHEDGSCGWEAITAPLAGDHIAPCLTALGDILGFAQIDERCGIHVHVDVSDLQWADMYRLLRVYALVEPLLFLLGGQERFTSYYCKPCGKKYQEALDDEDRKNKVLEAAYGADSERLTVPIFNTTTRQLETPSGRVYRRRNPSRRDGGRYQSLNIIPWLWARRHKAPNQTVEFRLHEGTQDTFRVIGWVQLCARLVDYVVRATDKEVAALPKSALRALCDDIAPDCREWILGEVKIWRRTTSYQDRIIHLGHKWWLEGYK
jgi:hypothetical protein